MCLGIPGKVESIELSQSPLILGTVNFGGIKKRVVLSCVPDVKVGDYVVVHVGFAISKIDEEEAGRVFDYLKEIGELEELQ